ncbi:hypothetical protein KC19_7G153100 [Ceratodon purpureus]|uniref:Uncharacterized protein n=1 Tax=Ceratodon purpureus TaxID=3225 RepID=A0A8T0H8X1_CERPU|nr:hypothetical protein KC19_7G153100 [Ceratodon purpureus]
MAMFYDGDSCGESIDETTICVGEVGAVRVCQLGDVVVIPREASDETLGYDQHFSGENLLDEYEIHDRHTFGSLSSFKRICRNFHTAMRVGRGQYLGFSNVKRSDIEAIDMIRRDIPKMTIRYDAEEEVLIIKFMAGAETEIFAGLLDSEFQALVRARGGKYSLIPMKSTRVKGSCRSKEPDNGYKPFDRRRLSDFPSVVLEIGMSESLGNLQVDAKQWIEDSQGKTRVVIIAAVNRATESVLIERWQDALGGAALQQQPGRQPTCGAVPLERQQAGNWANPNPYARNHFATLIQSLTLVKNQIYNGPSLTIPADLAFDNMPAGVHLGPNEFELDANTLEDLNSCFWEHVII